MSGPVPCTVCDQPVFNGNTAHPCCAYWAVLDRAGVAVPCVPRIPRRPGTRPKERTLPARTVTPCYRLA